MMLPHDHPPARSEQKSRIIVRFHAPGAVPAPEFRRCWAVNIVPSPRCILGMTRSTDEPNHPSEAPKLPWITCRRCTATVDLHTQIAAFDGKPAYKVFMCQNCDFIDFVETT
jgi:hypothetical protein